jgi:hypothetical protein
MPTAQRTDVCGYTDPEVQANDFEHHGGTKQGGISGLVVRRRHLDDIATNQIQTAQAM